MKYIFLLIIGFDINYSHAGIAENICNQLFHESGQDPSKQQNKLGVFNLALYAMNVAFKPSSLIEMQKIENNLSEHNSKKTELEYLKIAFITTKTKHLNEDEIEKLKIHRKTIKQYRSDLVKLRFKKNIRIIKSKESCIDYIHADTAVENKLQQMQDLIESDFELLQKEEEEKIAIEIEQKEKFLTRKNWKTIKDKNLNEIHKMIKNLKPSVVMIIGHSSSDGTLFDSELNEFPSGYFHSLQRDIDHLILYSCHTDEVLKKYNLFEIANKLNIFYPKVKERMKPFLGNKTPVIALKSIKNLDFRLSPSKSDSKLCHLKLDHKVPFAFSVFLNGIYLESGSDDISFECEFLEDSNEIIIHSTVDTEFKGKLEISGATLNQETKIKLEEFNNHLTNRHIVTKGNFNK